MRLQRQLVLLISLAFAGPAALANDLLITGTIYTADESNPKVEAVVITDRVFTFAGSEALATAMATDAHERIDLGSRIAYPGFIEAHGHLASLGKTIQNLDLRHARSYQDIVDKVAAAAAVTSPNQVIQGRGWHQSKWVSETTDLVDGFPTHHALSAVSPNNPVLLGHANGHSALINQAAMKAMGIHYATKTPEGGVIVRDKQGNPTGILHERAMGLAEPLTAFTKDSAKDAIIAAQNHALRWGITNFHDAGASDPEIQALHALDSKGALKLRVYTMVSARDTKLAEYWLARDPVIPSSDKRLTIRSFKVVMDGALGSRTAWLHAPYTDDPTKVGVQTFDSEILLDLLQVGSANGWQINTHAIGDKANTVALDAIEAAGLEDRDHRSRIEHAQQLRRADIERFKDLGVIASIQTIHMSSDRPWAIKRLGQDRIESGAYVWNDLLNAGVHLANGTDTPVEPINPVANFYAAVTRKTLAGLPEKGYEFRQALTREEALASMTLWNAYAAFQEQELGSISKGKRADLTVLTQDLMSVPEDEILNTEVAMTIIDGAIVYQSP
jgi:predicted amidohydrolase YtcJ